MSTTQEVAAGRKLRFLGDGAHGEKSVSTLSQNYDVEISPLDLINSYRQAYLIGVYSDPDAAPDTSSMNAVDASVVEAAPACPCGSVI